MQLSIFLRNVLKFDSATCLGTAALVVPTASILQDPFGIAAGTLVAGALPLIPIGLFMLWLGTRREASAAFVWLVILGNLGWVAGSFAAAASLPGITALGQAAVIGQALVVLVLAGLEWTGLKASTCAVTA